MSAFYVITVAVRSDEVISLLFNRRLLLLLLDIFTHRLTPYADT